MGKTMIKIWWDTRNVESIGWAYSTIVDGSLVDSGPLGPGYAKEHPSVTWRACAL